VNTTSVFILFRRKEGKRGARKGSLRAGDHPYCVVAASTDLLCFSDSLSPQKELSGRKEVRPVSSLGLLPAAFAI